MPLELRGWNFRRSQGSRFRTQLHYLRLGDSGDTVYSDSVPPWIEFGKLLLSGTRVFRGGAPEFRNSTRSGNSLKKSPSGLTAAEETNQQIAASAASVHSVIYKLPFVVKGEHSEMRISHSSVAIAAAGVLGAVAVAVPSPAGASALMRPAARSASPDAHIVAAARATGRPGVLLGYQAATNTWTQIAVIGNPQAVVQQDAVESLVTARPDALEPHLRWSPRIACLLISFTIGACADTAVTYENVVPSTAKSIIKSLETIDGDEAKELREGSNEIAKQRDTLEGKTAEQGDTTEGGYSNYADGVEDQAFDWGDGVVEVFVDLSFLAF